MARRSLLVDFITVYGLGGKAIVFTETKREADEVAAALANTHPCEVGPPVDLSWSRVLKHPSLRDAPSVSVVCVAASASAVGSFVPSVLRLAASMQQGGV